MNRQEFKKHVQRGGKLFVAAREIEREGRWLIKRGETVELRDDDGSDNPSFYFPIEKIEIHKLCMVNTIGNI